VIGSKKNYFLKGIIAFLFTIASALWSRTVWE